MKRSAAVAAILAAVIVAQGTASADGYRMHRQPDVWTGHFRHMARHHGDWRWRRAAIINQNNASLIAGYAAPSYGARYYGAAYAADYGHPAPPYADPAHSTPGVPRSIPAAIPTPMDAGPRIPPVGITAAAAAGWAIPAAAAASRYHRGTNRFRPSRWSALPGRPRPSCACRSSRTARSAGALAMKRSPVASSRPNTIAYSGPALPCMTV